MYPGKVRRCNFKVEYDCLANKTIIRHLIHNFKAADTLAIYRRIIMFGIAVLFCCKLHISYDIGLLN